MLADPALRSLDHIGGALRVLENIHPAAGLRFPQDAPGLAGSLMRIGHPEIFARVAIEIELDGIEVDAIVPAVDSHAANDHHREIALWLVVNGSLRVARDGPRKVGFAGRQ